MKRWPKLQYKVTPKEKHIIELSNGTKLTKEEVYTICHALDMEAVRLLDKHQLYPADPTHARYMISVINNGLAFSADNVLDSLAEGI